jgi:two-component sensor histidine kinase
VTSSTPSAAQAEFSSRPLRLRLLFWITIWLTPVAAISVVQGLDRIQRDIADVRERLFESARANAAQEQTVFASGEQVLRALANQPQVRGPGPDCAKSLAAALKGLVYFTNFYRIDRSGQILCAATPPPAEENNIASQNWWTMALRQNGFFIAPRSYSPVYQTTLLRGVLPLRSTQGVFDGAIVLVFDISWMTRLLQNRPLPPNTVLALFDPAGRIIAANDRGQAAMIFAGHPATDGMAQLRSAKVAGVSWSYVLAPISGRGIFAGYARRNRDLFAATYVHVATNLLLPIIMLALAYAAIWFATGRLIIHWLVYLRRIALAYTRGHYGVRPVALAAAPAEFRDLGETISVMADAVEDRDKRLRTALEQKSLLIRETHHRVKNNLQIVMSLLSLQGGRLRDPAARHALRQAQFRVNALALVHRILYENDDLGAIDLKKLIEEISRHVHEAAGREARHLRLEFNLVQRSVSSDQAAPLTLFLVEALTNAFHHAFPGATKGTVRVSLLPMPDGMLRLAVEDNGVGFAPPGDGEGIGARLIEAFARQVGGSAGVHRRDPSGTVVELLFPGRELERASAAPQDPFREPNEHDSGSEATEVAGVAASGWQNSSPPH